MPTGLRIETREDADACRLIIVGELSLAEAQILEERLGEVLETAETTIIVDLAGVEFIDSTGLSVLVRGHQQAAERGIDLGVVNPRAQANRLLSLTGLAERLGLGSPASSKAQRQADRGSTESQPGA